jgi:hypothetical protein
MATAYCFMALQIIQSLSPIKMEFVESDEINSPLPSENNETVPELIFIMASQEANISSFSMTMLNLDNNNEPPRLPVPTLVIN